MFEWSDEHQTIIDVVRRFVDEEIRPNLDDLEHNGVPPYDILRKMYDVFGLAALARENFERQLQRKVEGNDEPGERRSSDPALTIIPTIELCRVSPGLVTSLGVSTGLAAGTINKLGTPEQMKRWALELMTLEKIGAWAITEPDSGSDALGGMRTSARRDGDEYVLNGRSCCTPSSTTTATRRFAIDRSSPSCSIRVWRDSSKVRPCERWASTPRRPATYF
jgi:alkylation response protein AidB-like acyl-CoA dehydrogenase